MKTNSDKIHVATILGTRPEIIRLARIIPKLDEYCNHTLIFTQQSYDYELSSVFFKEFNLRKPDYTFPVKAERLGKQIANILSGTEEVLMAEKPDAVFVVGDTNTVLSIINARRLKIPIFHFEAGNRSFDWNVPEEVNRRVADHISNYNIAYTEHARRYLIAEGISPETIFVVGSPLSEVYAYFKSKITSSTILDNLVLKPRQYFLVSTHREENVDNEQNLKELFDSLNYLANLYKFPIIVSVHPRTKKRLEMAKFKLNTLIRLYKPFGYFDYNKLQINSTCVLSDSGTIQEESAIMNFPAIQIRVSTERPEAFDTGSIILTGFNSVTISSAIAMQMKQYNSGETIICPQDYKAVNVSDRVVKLLLGLTGIHKYKRS